MKRAPAILAAVLATVAIVPVVMAAPGGHDPVTICHKPGTPAEKTLAVDSAALRGHLAHGDYLGPCEPKPTPTPVWTVDVNGCDVVLYQDGGQSVDLFGPDTLESWTTLAAEGGYVYATADTIQFAPGHYVAVWDNGLRVEFDLACPIDPDPSTDPGDTTGGVVDPVARPGLTPPPTDTQP